MQMETSSKMPEYFKWHGTIHIKTALETVLKCMQVEQSAVVLSVISGSRLCPAVDRNRYSV